MDTRPIKQVEHDLIIKFVAHSYLPMLDAQGDDRVRLETIYKMPNGGLEAWVRTRIVMLLEKARKLRQKHGATFISAGAVRDCEKRIAAALHIGNGQTTNEIGVSK